MPGLWHLLFYCFKIFTLPSAASRCWMAPRSPWGPANASAWWGATAAANPPCCKLAAGLLQAAWRHAVPAAGHHPCAICRRSRISGFCHHAGLCGGRAWGRATIVPRHNLLEPAWPERRGRNPPTCRAARRGARRWRGRWRPSPICCCWTSRPTIWICRRSNGWKPSLPRRAAAWC